MIKSSDELYTRQTLSPGYHGPKKKKKKSTKKKKATKRKRY